MLEPDASHRPEALYASDSKAPRPANAGIATTLFVRERSGLVGFLGRRLDGNREAAEDIAQEAMARIAGAGRAYAPERARGLLYTIARHLLIDHFRAERAKRNVIATSSMTDDEIEPLDPLRTLIAREDLEHVRRAIGDLPPRCRKVFVLSRFEHMSYAAIAQHCAISVSMVEKHMQRALCQLAGALVDKDGDGTR